MDKHLSTRPWTARLAALLRRRPATAARNLPRARPRLEPLEDRCVPTITVNSTADAGFSPSGTVTLRSAIAQAEAESTPDHINFAPSLSGQTITLGSLALPTLTKGETITGTGAASVTISGYNASRIFTVTSSSAVNLTGLTLTDAVVGNSGYGGAILNSGALTLTDDIIKDCLAGYGGAVYSNGAQLTVNDCTFTDNIGGYRSS